MLNRSRILIQAKFVHVSIQNCRSIAKSLDANLLQKLWGVSYVSVELIAHSWRNVCLWVASDFMLMEIIPEMHWALWTGRWNYPHLPTLNCFLLKLASIKLALVQEEKKICDVKNANGLCSVLCVVSMITNSAHCATCVILINVQLIISYKT